MANSPLPRGAARRAAFTLVEIMVAMAAIAVVGVVVGQCLVWSLLERARLTAHQAAVELAANILEEARARPWAQLDREWATAQSVPSDMNALLPEGKLLVTLEPGPVPQTRRVTVEVQWQFGANLAPQKVKLIGVLSSREGKKPGGHP